MIIGDLQVSNGDSVAKEVGENATFVPTDVSIHLLRIYCAHNEQHPRSLVLCPIELLIRMVHETAGRDQA